MAPFKIFITTLVRVIDGSRIIKIVDEADCSDVYIHKQQLLDRLEFLKSADDQTETDKAILARYADNVISNIIHSIKDAA